MNNNDESKLMKKIIKKDFNKLGVTLLMQALIMNIVIFVGCIGAATMQVLKEPNVNESELMESINKFCFSGTTMIIAVVIAFITIIIYRRKKLFQYDIRLQNKQFNLNVAIKAFIILFSVNNILMMFTNGLELGLNTIGLSANSALEDLEILNQSTVSMIMYTCIVAPIIEELIYRGAVLRSLEKYGKRFSILVSGILFGLMHGNFYQIFMATCFGIILGYLATEYSIKLTILLHICNNTCVEILSQITSHFGGNIGNIIDISMTIISAIILIIAFIRNKNYIKQWLQNNTIEKGILVKFFTSISVIIKIIFDLLIVATGITAIY